MVAIAHALSTLYASAAASTAWQWPSSWLSVTNCNITDKVSSLVLPANQTQLVVPTNISLSFVGLAFGVQNYTCSQTNNFTSAGAVAELFDVSCLAGSSTFSSLPDQLFDAWANTSSFTVQQAIEYLHMKNPPEVLAQHYFITNPVTGSGLSPKWDFTSSGKFEGQESAFIVAKGQGSLPAPTDPTKDVAWLEVANVQGSAADIVFRTDTRGGQPPSSCAFGQSQDISVKYVSYYWFFGGSIYQ